MIAKPLHWLVRKGKKWNWEEASESLKKVFVMELDLDKEMRVEVEVSEYATGGVLNMRCKDEK